MTGAIEFLRKAKAICKDRDNCIKCPPGDFCMTDKSMIEEEADLVSKVMAYEIKEDDRV